ncbi:MAG TPA: hypothetical protein VFQ80_01460, partial [Thermomicrobiales bacterium]|nr:hypothetical protein [Thermomicrobiales bacterium]
ALLRDKRLLLVLDNFEHVLEAAPLLSGLFAAAPGLTALATSRAPLRLRGEREFAIAPLGLPAGGASQIDAALASDAVRLFEARASDVQADFAIDAVNAGAVADICRELDGLPLAIELAAARIKLLPPGALLNRLRPRLPLLTGGPRDAPPRQRDLSTTIAWSYDLLSAEEQRLFRRLAVFVGGCTLEAAEAVADRAGDLGLDVVDGIAALLDDSLLRNGGGSHAVNEEWLRYGMLLTIREYALERLRESGEFPAAQQALEAFLLAFAGEAERGLQGPDQARWLDRLDAEHDNLRAALGDAAQRGDGEFVLRLGVRLWRFWLMRGYPAEGRSWLERALAGGAAAPPNLRAQARQGLGHLAVDLGAYAEAERQFSASLALCREANDRPGLAESLSGLAVVALNRPQNREQYAAAQTLLEEALAIRRDLGLDVVDGIAALLDDSLLRNGGGSHAANEEWLRYGMLLTIREYALERLRESGEFPAAQQALEAFLLAFAGEAEQGLQGPDQARWLDRLDAEHDNLRAALGDAAQRGDGEFVLRLAVRLWRFWLMRGYPAEGRAWLERALAAGAAAPPNLRAQARQGLGHLAVDLGAYAEAERQFSASLALCREANDRPGLAESLSGLAVVALNR